MARKKKTWFSVIKRLFITDQPQSRLDNKKDKRRRWVFRLLKMKEVAGLSKSSPAREMLPWQTTQSKQQTQMSQDLAATKIQAAFRGYLARKALGALKGVVKLQALIRGWAVRQQAIKTLKCLQSLVNIQSQVFSKRSCERIKESMHDFCEKDINVDLNSQKRWDDSTLTKEEIKALFATKREGCVKRERVKEYYLNHRRSAETERDRVYGRRRYWLEQWVDSQLAKSDGPKKKLDTTLSSNARNREEINGRLRNFEKQYQAEMCETPTYVPRRSYHHRKQRSIGDEHSLTGSPSYMASTESAKARARSLSSPRLRPLSFDVCSETSSPYKHKLSPISSINSELTSSSWIMNHVSSSQRSSPCFKGLPGPVKSSMSSKELRIRGMHHQSGTS